MCTRSDEGLSPSPETKTFSLSPSWTSLPTASMIAGSGRPVSIASVILCMTMNRIAFFLLGARSGARRRRWWAALRFVDRAHDPDRVPVGVLHDRVPGPPEGVVGSLLASVPRAQQARMHAIDFLSRRDVKKRQRSGAELCLVEPRVPLLR